MPLLLFLTLAVLLSPNAAPRSLSLVEALALADQHDRGLESARIDIEEGDALVREATSGALPNLSFGASTSRFVIAPTSRIPALGDRAMRLVSANDLTLGLSLAQPIWLGGRLGLAMDAAKTYRRLSRASIQATRANLKKQVIQEYFRLVLAMELVRVMEATYAQASAHAEKAGQMFDVGMISEFDLLRAQTEVKALEPELERSRQSAELAKVAFCNRIGLSPEEDLTLSDGLEPSSVGQAFLPVPSADPEEAFKQALGVRPEFQVTGLREELNTIALKVEERSLYWPNVFFSLGYQTQGLNDHYYNMEPKTWSKALRWGVNVAIPLFDGLATPARVQKAKLGLRRTQLARQQLEDGVRLEVTAALTELKRAGRQASSQEAALNLAERAYDISLVRYEQGAGTEIEVQDARLSLSRARLGYLQGLYDARVARAEYARVVENDAELIAGER